MQGAGAGWSGKSDATGEQQMTTDVDSQLRAEIEPYFNRLGPWKWSRTEIETGAIWNFCEAVEDANPIYWDAQTAEASRFGRPLAPPQALMALNMAHWWAPEYVRERDQQKVSDDGDDPQPSVMNILARFGYGTATNVTREEEYLDPFGPGDGRIRQASRYVHLSPVKQTKVGEGVFITTEIDYRTEHRDRVIARARNVLLMYNPDKPRE